MAEKNKNVGRGMGQAMEQLVDGGEEPYQPTW